MEAVAFPDEDFVQEVGGSIDDEVLFLEFERGVHAAEDFDDAQAVERAVRVPDGAEDFFRTVFRGGVAFRDGEVGAELALEVAHMAGGEELRAAADAEVQVGGRDLLEFDAEAF